MVTLKKQIAKQVTQARKAMYSMLVKAKKVAFICRYTMSFIWSLSFANSIIWCWGLGLWVYRSTWSFPKKIFKNDIVCK